MYEKLFEKHINGIVNEESFMQLSQKYETERDKLKVKIRQYQEELSEIENLRTSKEQFTLAVRKFMQMETLTPALLNELIEKIEVHSIEGKVNGVIRTCPKASLFAAFRRFGIERRQPSCNLNIQKSAENSSLSGRRIFTEQIFGQPRHKTQQILFGFASILTKGERKYARENHGSYYSIHLKQRA